MAMDRGFRISNSWKRSLTASAFSAAVVTTLALSVVAGGPVVGNHAPETSFTTQNTNVAETEAGNLVADAIRAEFTTAIGFVPAAAFKPGASAPRPASAEQAISLLESPADTISVLHLRGDQIIAALERSVSFEPQTSSGFLQISGLRFTYDVHKEGGKRIASATVNGQPLDAAKVYEVATTKPLAIGQNGYFQIWDKSDIASDSTKSLEIAIKDYIKSRNGTVSPTLDGRIVQIAK